MATIDITDNFGLDVAVDPNPSSAFAKYIKDPKALLAKLGTLKNIGALKLSDDPFQSQTAGVTFPDTITLGSNGAELIIQPSLDMTVAIATGKSLFDPATDPFGDSLPIPAGDAYVSLAIKAKLEVSATNSTTADLQFGIDDQTKVDFADYRPFPLSTPIVDALKTLFGQFTIPANIADIDAMAPGSIATVAGTGTLKLTAEASLPAGVNPLAVVTDTIENILVVDAGGTIAVNAAFTLSGGYQVRVQRQAGRKFELGFLRQRSTELAVSVEASLGVTATAGEDWIQVILKAISSDPAPDKDALKKDGLTDDQIASINAALKTGVERSLQLAATAEIDSLASDSKAFSYAIDLDVVDKDSSGSAHAAITRVLRGDLSDLERGSLAGITPVRSVFTSLKQRKTIYQLNILGIINVASIHTLVTQGTVIVDHESGAVTITDKVTGQTIGFTSSNFAKDNAKLRKVLADATVVTSAYHTGGVLTGLKITTSKWFFDFHRNTNLDNLKDALNITQALGVITGAKAAQDVTTLQAAGGAIGQSVFNVNAAFDDGLFRSMFLVASSARPAGDYSLIGRTALAALIRPGDPTSDARREPLTDDAMWNDLVEAVNLSIAATTFFEKYPQLKNFSSVILSDFVVIDPWADAMSNMAKPLEAMQSFMASNPKWTRDDSQFKQLHQALNKAIRGLAAHTSVHFGEPLGLLAMDLASNQKAPTTVQFSSPRLSFTATR